MPEGETLAGRGRQAGTTRCGPLPFALKYDFIDAGPIRPFLALGVGGARLDQDPGWRPSGSISAGFDLYLSRDVFATLELKQRAFTHDTGHSLEISSVHQTGVFAGVGFYL